MIARLFLFILFSFPAICAYADVPDNFPVEGTIWDLARNARSIVVQDRLYYLSATTRIERADGQTGARTDLAKGQRVGLNFTVDDRRQPILTTIWILSEQPLATQSGPGTRPSGVPAQ